MRLIHQPFLRDPPVGSAVSNRNWVVHKFGGTSVANAECFRRVARLMHDQSEPRQAVVVSAMGGMTNALLELINGAERADGKVAAGIVFCKKSLLFMLSLFKDAHPNGQKMIYDN